MTSHVCIIQKSVYGIIFFCLVTYTLQIADTGHYSLSDLQTYKEKLIITMADVLHISANDVHIKFTKDDSLKKNTSHF